MKHAPLLVLAGTVAGFVGVFAVHTRPAGLVTSGTPAAAPSAPSAGPVAAGGAVRTALGVQEQFGYGVLSVRVTVTGTRITDVSVPTLQVIDPTSQQICDQVFPMLRSEVLSAQSATIDGVSGATYTSASYAQSLQSALDQLHIK